MISLIDGDILVYSCGFASDAEAKKAEIEHEPLEFCLQGVKANIEQILEVTEADDYKVFLTGEGNFRLDIQPDYKANRDEKHKPYWYKEIKDYLINMHGAEVVDGMEADDALGIMQCTSEEWTCICSKDKDLDGVPGFHYNWSPKNIDKGVYWVDEVDANRFFYTQCLTGDSVDNIPGLKKSIGKVATKKKKQVLQELESELGMYHWVRECYEGFDFTPIAQCLWILREEGKLWEPPSG